MTSTNSTIFKCFSTIDAEGYRYLLGDYAGSLYTLHLLLNRAGNQVDFVKLESVGTGGNYSNMTIPQTLTHLTPSLVFVGSHFGDSLMLQFKSEEVEDDDRQKRKRRKDDDEDYAMALDNEGEDIAVTSSATTTNQGGGPFNVVATYPGLSPILDFCVVDLENRGQVNQMDF